MAASRKTARPRKSAPPAGTAKTARPSTRGRTAGPRKSPSRAAPAAGNAPAARSGALIRINRAPVLTLWAAVVAERLGHARDAALTLGKVMAGMNAYRKGVAIGVFEESKDGAKRTKRAARTIELLDVPVPVVRTAHGLRAIERGKPVDPETVERYLQSKFAADLARARRAMERLARAIPKPELAERARALYERFRPTIPAGQRGWGAKGVLDLETIAELANER